jgi:putative oxidoreductase
MDRDRIVTITLTLLRVMAGAMFLQAGGMKMLGWFGGMPPNGATAHFPTQVWFGGVLELVGGGLIVLGLFTRPVAFVLSGMMAVAYWQFHAPGGFWPIVNKGELAVLFCFIFLFMAAYGGGAWSLDAVIRGKRKVNVAVGSE